MIGADRFIGNKDETLVKKHVAQRYERGFSDLDMWNFDVFLADVIIVGCQYQIDRALTVPGHLEYEEWKDILITIRDSFASRDDVGAPHPSKKAWKLLRKNFQYLWD